MLYPVLSKPPASPIALEKLTVPEGRIAVPLALASLTVAVQVTAWLITGPAGEQERSEERRGWKEGRVWWPPEALGQMSQRELPVIVEPPVAKGGWCTESLCGRLLACCIRCCRSRPRRQSPWRS